MASQATVQLVVDESGAVPGLTRFQQRAMAAMQQPTVAAKELGAQINAAGVAVGMGTFVLIYVYLSWDMTKIFIPWLRPRQYPGTERQDNEEQEANA